MKAKVCIAFFVLSIALFNQICSANTGTIEISGWSPASTVSNILIATDNQKVYLTTSDGNRFVFALLTSGDEAMYAILVAAMTRSTPLRISARYSTITSIDGGYYNIDRIQSFY